MNKYKKTILSNKAPIIMVPLAGAPTATALLIFKTGSRHENRSNNGISHFLEHMFFKGTTKRPDTLTIASDFDSLGCEFNAFTSKEYTGYWVKTAENKLAAALDILADMILHSTFPEEEIEREKGVIIEELNMYEDNPLMHIEEVLESCLFGDTPAGWDTIGTKENIQGFKRKDFIDYLESQYGANSANLILAGGVTSAHFKKGKEIMSKLEKNKWHDQKKGRYLQTKPKVKAVYKDIDQVNLSLAVRTFPVNSKEELPVKLLALILGGAMSSRLFINLRERNGLAYYVKTTTEFYSDAGYLTTSAGVPIDKATAAVKIILSEYDRLRTELVPKAELKRAQDLLRGRLLLQLEATDNLANWYARQAVCCPEIVAPAEFIKKIRSITAEDLRRVAKKIFQNKNLNLALIGRVKAAQFEKIVKL